MGAIQHKIAILVIGILGLGLAACEQPEFQDRENISVAPDNEGEVTVWSNMNNHPNIVRICADGLAFLTVSTNHQNGFTDAIRRIPEWDEACP